MTMAYDKTTERSANLDPITKEPGAHPVGTGVGAAAGGMAAGAAIGTFAGPVGAAIGAAAGAVLGGLAGKGVAESIDPTIEHAYWRDNYSTRDYVDADASYDDYGPAYGYGVEAFGRRSGDTFEAAEPSLSKGWDASRGKSRLGWDKARHAARDAWNRVSAAAERAIPGDSDRDGK
jgi:hypothetical protein